MAAAGEVEQAVHQALHAPARPAHPVHCQPLPVGQLAEPGQKIEAGVHGLERAAQIAAHLRPVVPALDALDAWISYHQSGGATGSAPPEVLGAYTRE